MGIIRKSDIQRGVKRLLACTALLSLAAGLSASAPVARDSVLPPSSLSVPDAAVVRADTSSLMSFSAFGSVFNPADGVGLYAGLNFSVDDIINGYAMGSAISLPATDYVSDFEGGVSYAGVRMMLADGVRFNFGKAFADTYRRGSSVYGAGFSADHDRSEMLMSGLSWDFAKWGGVSLTGSETHVRDVALGNAASAMDLARMASLGLTAHVGFGDGWVTSVSYKQASLKLSLNPGISSAANPVLHRQSFGIAVAKRGLFGRDALGLSLTRPSGNFSTAPHLPQDMQFQFYGRDKLFPNKSAQETDIGLGYVTSFLDGPIALQANASYQLNALGQNKDSLTVMSRAKIKF